MTVKLLREHHFEFLSVKGGCTGLPESKLVKMPHNVGNHMSWLILPCLANMYNWNMVMSVAAKHSTFYRGSLSYSVQWFK